MQNNSNITNILATNVMNVGSEDITLEKIELALFHMKPNRVPGKDRVTKETLHLKAVITLDAVKVL